MAATGLGPARAAFERLMARYAAGLRAGSAVAAGTAAVVGFAPPASSALVGLAVAGLLLWAGSYATVALTRGWTRWLVPGDIAVAAALCLSHRALVPAEVMADGSSWVFVVASTTVIVSQLSPRPLLGVAATVLVTGAHAGGLLLAGRADSFAFTVVLAVQGALVGLLMPFLRGASRAADAAIAEREAVERDAAVRAARRAEEREHVRLLHDSVSATLTVVSTGGVAVSSPALRGRAGHDLQVLERIQAPAGPASQAGSARVGAGGHDLARWLTAVTAGMSPGLAVEPSIEEVTVPDSVGAALAGAVAEALANVRQHARVARARLRATPSPGGVLVELTDDGIGFDPGRVPAHRRGLRESVVGRMRAVGGSAVIISRPGTGTRILLRWPTGPAGQAEPPRRCGQDG
jgi:signal transduction histidine kinase